MYVQIQVETTGAKLLTTFTLISSRPHVRLIIPPDIKCYVILIFLQIATLTYSSPDVVLVVRVLNKRSSRFRNTYRCKWKNKWKEGCFLWIPNKYRMQLAIHVQVFVKQVTEKTVLLCPDKCEPLLVLAQCAGTNSIEISTAVKADQDHITLLRKGHLISLCYTSSVG